MFDYLLADLFTEVNAVARQSRNWHRTRSMLRIEQNL